MGPGMAPLFGARLVSALAFPIKVRACVFLNFYNTYNCLMPTNMDNSFSFVARVF